VFVAKICNSNPTERSGRAQHLEWLRNSLSLIPPRLLVSGRDATDGDGSIATQTLAAVRHRKAQRAQFDKFSDRLAMEHGNRIIVRVRKRKWLCNPRITPKHEVIVRAVGDLGVVAGTVHSISQSFPSKHGFEVGHLVHRRIQDAANIHSSRLSVLSSESSQMAHEMQLRSGGGAKSATLPVFGGISGRGEQCAWLVEFSRSLLAG